MTIHLSVLTPAYILQVSDRRITRTDTGAAYPLANKNVVFLASDGIVTIGYTGLTYLEGVPTDTWIACKLAAEDHGPFRDGESQGMLVSSQPKFPWLDIGRAVALLKKETEAAFGRLRYDQLLRHQIEIVGWQRHRKRIRPVEWIVENSDAEPRVFTSDMAERYEHYEKAMRMYAIPDGVLSSDELPQFNLKDHLWPPHDCMKALVGIVRYVAARNDGVGPDCMAIFLPNPNLERKCYFKYEPVSEGRAHFAAGEQKFEVPAAFSPWFVGPQLHAPPAILVGRNIVFPALGDYEIVGYSPPAPKGDIRSGMGSRRLLGGLFMQDRPREPRRRRQRPNGT